MHVFETLLFLPSYIVPLAVLQSVQLGAGDHVYTDKLEHHTGSQAVVQFAEIN